MNQVEVEKALRKHFTVHISKNPDPARQVELSEWLFIKLLKNDGSDVANKNLRLATSIAFEATSGNLPAKIIYHKIFERKNDEGAYFITTSNDMPAHVQFHSATVFEMQAGTRIDFTHSNLYHKFYETFFQTSDHPANGYMRCINFADFHDFYITKDENSKDKQLGHEEYMDDVQWDENHNYLIPFPAIPIENNVNMRGGKPLAWVTPTAEIVDSFSLDNPPVELAQRLGIFVKNDDTVVKTKYNDVLVAIHYKDGFKDKVYQPATIHADWNGGGFVSYKKNDGCYGLTFNCSVIGGKCVPERIHISFPVVTVGENATVFDSIIVGRVNVAVNLDFSKILTESFRRFEQLITTA